MQSNINKSLRRHNKRNHGAVNGTGHMGGVSWKLAENSPKFGKVLTEFSNTPTPLKLSLDELANHEHR